MLKFTESNNKIFIFKIKNFTMKKGGFIFLYQRNKMKSTLNFSYNKHKTFSYFKAKLIIQLTKSKKNNLSDDFEFLNYYISMNFIRLNQNGI